MQFAVLVKHKINYSRLFLFFRLVERYRNPKAEINQKPFRVAAQTDNLVQKYSVVKAKELNAEREQ